MSLYRNRIYLEGLRTAGVSPAVWEQLSGKQILITGATGLIGRCLMDLLMSKNQEDGLNCHIYAVSRSEEAAKKRLPKVYFDSGWFTYLAQDVSEPFEEAERLQVDYVLHMAGNTHPVLYASKPIETMITNLYGTKNLLDFAVECKAERFVFLSSVEIYGESRGDTGRFKEEDMGILNCNVLRAGYPESKRFGEALCQAYREEKGLDIVIPRLPRVYGPTMLPEDSKAAAQFIKRAVQGRDIVLKSKGNQQYSFLHVLDAVTGILTVMIMGESGEAYNLADERSDATLREAAGFAAQVAGKQVVYEVADETEKKGYSMATKAVMDGAKIRKLGWKPGYTIEKGFRDTIAILKETGFRS